MRVKVMGRTSVSLAVLLTGLLFFYAAFAISPALAQDNGSEDMVSGDQSNNQQDDQDCPVPEEVNTTTGSGDEQSPVFDITGGSFRVTIDVDAEPDLDDPSLAGVTVRVRTENNDPVTTIAAEGDGTETSIVNAGKDSFFLDILAANANYEITVEDCTGDTGDDGANDNGNDEDTDNDGVIDDTVPDKDLPNTGGLSLIVSGGIFLFSALGILAAWRSRER